MHGIDVKFFFKVKQKVYYNKLQKISDLRNKYKEIDLY